jgi:hypothetical protein
VHVISDKSRAGAADRQEQHENRAVLGRSSAKVRDLSVSAGSQGARKLAGRR